MQRIMYVENKETGVARIGLVTKVKSTLIYKDQKFRSLRSRGFKAANYYDIVDKDEYWISGCHKDGGDALFPLEVYIDEDVREEYWLTIRNLPESVLKTSFKSVKK